VTAKTPQIWPATTSSCCRRCSSSDLREGLRLYEEGTDFGSFDAVLAAAARAAGANALVSADTGFSSIAAIHHVIPDADGILQLLGTSEE